LAATQNRDVSFIQQFMLCVLSVGTLPSARCWDVCWTAVAVESIRTSHYGPHWSVPTLCCIWDFHQFRRIHRGYYDTNVYVFMLYNFVL